MIRDDVTVIIACGGSHGRIVEGAVESAIAAGPDHIVVVDDQANPPVEIKRSSRVQLIRSENHIGRSAARNMAVTWADTTWLYFLDADDWMEPSAIRDFRNILHGSREEPKLIYADYHYRAGNGTGRLILVRKAQFIRKPGDTRNLVNIGMFVKRDRFSLIGGFDEDMSMGEYWDFFLRYTANPRITVHKHSRPFFIARQNGSIHPNPKRALVRGSMKIKAMIKGGYYQRWEQT